MVPPTLCTSRSHRAYAVQESIYEICIYNLSCPLSLESLQEAGSAERLRDQQCHHIPLQSWDKTITQRTAREILHEEHKDCKTCMRNLHLTCTHGGLKLLFLGKVSKKQIQGHIQASSQSPLKKEQAPCISLSISAFAIIEEIK